MTCRTRPWLVLGLALFLGLLSPASLPGQAPDAAPTPPPTERSAVPEAQDAPSPAAAPAEAAPPAEQAAAAAKPETKKAKKPDPMVKNDAIVLAMLLAILAFVFVTSSSSHAAWKTFYKVIPSLLLCYFLPSLLTNFGVIDPKASNLYPVARDYLLPTSLVLLTLSIDLKGVFRLGPIALIMFLVATAGIVLGGPFAILVTRTFAPEWVAGDVWKGMSTAAGSWIGGSANQAAMQATWNVPGDLYSAFIAVDVIVANIWMAGLLLIARNAKSMDARFKADSSAVDALREKVEKFEASVRRMPTTADIMMILAVGFAVTGLGHWVAEKMVPLVKASSASQTLIGLGLGSGFFWIIVTATTGALLLSFTPLRKLEGAGASRLGSVLLYVLVATIGMMMDISAVGEQWQLFIVGGIWMAFHVTLLFIAAKIFRAPMFFLAVGSKANVGGAASAPIVASAFHPALAPVGVLLAVVGYALGTYAAWLSAVMMRAVAP